MIDFFPDQLGWWITAVDVPLITAFIAVSARWRASMTEQMDDLRERLNGFKLDVAQSYASVNHVKDIESRVIAHLLRIETKLDTTAMKLYRGETT